MILLDTNVVSEISSKKPINSHVYNWFGNQRLTNMYVSTVTLAELLYGVALLPEGRHKEQIRNTISPFIVEFQPRTLSFDIHSTSYYAAMAARRHKAGLSVSTSDIMIAAIAMSNGMTVATRNVKDFVGTNVKIINPWEYEN